MKLLKKIDHNILSLLGMYAVVLIAMAILNPSTYYSTLNIKSWFYLFPEYGILTFGMMLCMISADCIDSTSKHCIFQNNIYNNIRIIGTRINAVIL